MGMETTTQFSLRFEPDLIRQIDEEAEKEYSLAGRVITIRLHGKTGFCTIQDIMNDIEQFDFNETQIEQSLADYKNIQDSYIQLPRGRFNQYDLVLLKYKMEVFNYWFSQKLIQNIDKLPHDNKKLQDLFDSFPFILKDNQAKKIS